MKYPDGGEARLGDRVGLWDGNVGVVICPIDTNEYLVTYPQSLTQYVAMRQSCFPVIARSPCDEAIHLTPRLDMDCFAALAMTYS